MNDDTVGCFFLLVIGGMCSALVVTAVVLAF